MIRNLKALGLALVAVMAMSAFVASAAQAVPQVTVTTSPASIHGTGEVGEEFKLDGVGFRCKVSHYTGTVSNGATSVELTPEYTECKDTIIGATVHVRHNECKYRFNLTEGTTVAGYKAHVDIVCPVGKAIEVETTSPSCRATIGSQNGLTTVDISNVLNAKGEPNDVSIRPTIAGVVGTVDVDGFLCPFSGTGVKTGGTYTSEAGITGTATTGTIHISG